MAQIKQDHGTRIPKLFIFFIIVFLSMTLTFVTAYAERPQKNLSPRTNLPIIEKSEWIIECPEKRNVMTSLGLGLYEFVNKKADYALQDVLCKSLETKNPHQYIVKGDYPNQYIFNEESYAVLVEARINTNKTNKDIQDKKRKVPFFIEDDECYENHSQYLNPVLYMPKIKTLFSWIRLDKVTTFSQCDIVKDVIHSASISTETECPAAQQNPTPGTHECGGVTNIRNAYEFPCFNKALGIKYPGMSVIASGLNGMGPHTVFLEPYMERGRMIFSAYGNNGNQTLHNTIDDPYNIEVCSDFIFLGIPNQSDGECLINFEAGLAELTFDLPLMGEDIIANYCYYDGDGSDGLSQDEYNGSAGNGIKIAIIDNFKGLSVAIDGFMIPPEGYGLVIDSSAKFASTHGTNVATVIHQLAPYAELRLYSFPNNAGCAERKLFLDDLGATDVDIIHMSQASWGCSFHDGDVLRPIGEAITNLVTVNNKVVVISADNQGEKHRMSLEQGLPVAMADPTYGDDICSTLTSNVMNLVPIDEQPMPYSDPGKTAYCLQNWYDGDPATLGDVTYPFIKFKTSANQPSKAHVTLTFNDWDEQNKIEKIIHINHITDPWFSLVKNTGNFPNGNQWDYTNQGCGYYVNNHTEVVAKIQGSSDTISFDVPAGDHEWILTSYNTDQVFVGGLMCAYNAISSQYCDCADMQNTGCDENNNSICDTEEDPPYNPMPPGLYNQECVKCINRDMPEAHAIFWGAAYLDTDQYHDKWSVTDFSSVDAAIVVGAQDASQTESDYFSDSGLIDYSSRGFSNQNFSVNTIDIVAPSEFKGIQVKANNTTGFGFFAGTSMSSPVVTAAIALMASQPYYINNGGVVQAAQDLLNNAYNNNSDPAYEEYKFGNGILSLDPNYP